MITLYQFPPGGGLPNFSPFCLKLETWLRIAGLEYRNKYIGDPRKTPLGKLPMIDIDGDRIADSGCIVDALKQRRDLNPDRHLDTATAAANHMLTRMLEEHTYWALLYTRWVEPRGWEQLRAEVFAGFPPGIRHVVPPLIRRGLTKALEAHGLGRHPHEEIIARGTRDLAATAVLLGERPFFGGEYPCSADATAYGFLAQLLLSTLESSLTPAAQAHENLVAYTQRMQTMYFGEDHD